MQARTLDVGVLTEAQEIDIATALLRADSNWERLKTLSIMYTSNVWEQRTDGDPVSFHSALAWLLGCVKDLDLLSLRIDELRWLSRLANLKHLQLSQRGRFCRIAQCLSNLKNLQTPFLENSIYCLDPAVLGVDWLQPAAECDAEKPCAMHL